MLRLQAGDTAAVALTKATHRNASGGILAETIVRILSVQIPPNVTIAECGDVDGRVAVLGWLDHGRHAATVFTTDGHDLFKTEIPYSDDKPCEIGQN